MVKIKLFQIGLINTAKVYQIVLASKPKKGRYEPGIKISFSKSGSINTITLARAPHSMIRLKIFGIHFIV